ncbi:TetR/AcrR family transcriptional regulator [Streptomyces sp. NPDC002004]
MTDTPDLRTDGRAERGRLTRERIAEALLALLDEGDPFPAADRIAARAQVSRRLVFHHFADMEQLLDTAVRRRMQEIFARATPLPATGPRPERVAALVAQRSEIYEWITPARQAAIRVEPGSPRLTQARDEMFAWARERLSEVFAQELDGLPPATRTDTLAALDAVTAWAAWNHWRTTGLDLDQCRRAMRTAVNALLDQA